MHSWARARLACAVEGEQVGAPPVDDGPHAIAPVTGLVTSNLGVATIGKGGVMHAGRVLIAGHAS